MKKPIGLRMAMLTVAVAAALALPAQAMAGDHCSTTDPTNSQYCNPIKVIGTGSASGVAAVQGASTSGSSGSLPFTGLDVISLLAIAAALTGAGLVLRRLTVGGGERSS